MLHLIKYNLLVKLKNFGTTFWPLVFPILLGTMFYFAFGNINDADFATVSVAVVRQEKADTLFLMFLDQVENNADQLISTKELTYDEAASWKMSRFPVFMWLEKHLPLPFLQAAFPKVSCSPFFPATKPAKPLSAPLCAPILPAYGQGSGRC